MAKMSGKDAATMIAEALGLEPTDVNCLSIEANVHDIVTVRVRLFPEVDAIEKVAGVLREYELTPKQKRKGDR